MALSLDGIEPAKLRTCSRYAIAFSIVLLLAASMGLFPLEMSIVAVIVTLIANGILISYATTDRDSYSQPADGPIAQPRIDRRTCALGYATVPITAIAVVSLALYKAAADATSETGTASDVSSGRGQATQEAAVAFLKFVGCGWLFQGGDHGSVRETVTLLHTKFIGSALFAAFAYVTILGLRVVCSDSDLVTSETQRTRELRSNSRLAFCVAVGLLVFAVIGFQPIIFTSIACFVSVTASAIMLYSAVDPPSTAEAGMRLTATDTMKHAVRTQLQAHAFSIVTLACLYCLGCILMETVALSGNHASSRSRQEAVRLQFVGFQLSFAAATWFAITLAVRAYFKTLDTARSER